MSKQITILRKAGQIEEAYNLAVAIIKETSPSDSSFIWVQRALSWVLYDQLKAIDYVDKKFEWFQKVDEIVNAEIDSSEVMFWNSFSSCVYKALKSIEVDKQDLIVDFCKKIPFTKLVESNSSQYFNYIIHKTLKDHKDYGVVIDQLGFDNFSEEDYQMFTMENGKSIMSHVEQVICAYTKWLLKEQSERVSQIVSYDDKVRQWIKTISNLSNGQIMKFPMYCQAKLFAAINDNESAKKVLLPFVKDNSSQFWVWSTLASLESNKDTKAALYARALQCKTKDSFLSNVRSQLIEYFVAQNMWNHASVEINKVVDSAKSNKFTISNRISSLANDSRIVNAIVPDNHKEVLNTLAQNSDQILYSDDPSSKIIITHINTEKSIVSYFEDKSSSGFFPLSLLKFKVTIGDSVDVKFADKSTNGFTKLNLASKSSIDHPAIKIIRTYMTIDSDRQFQIIENTFFHYSLIEFQNGNFNIEYMAIPSFDKKRGKWGYRAIKVLSLTPIEN